MRVNEREGEFTSALRHHHLLRSRSFSTARARIFVLI